MLTRRSALLGLSAAATLAGPLGRASLALAAAPTQQRFVVIILRGALDGLAAMVPYGDPNLATWRAALLPPGPGQDGGVLDLGGFHGLHPALAGLHRLYAAGELLPIPAVVGPTSSRSHFEAQDDLESGTNQRLTSGWLNRLVGQLGNGAPNAAGSLALAVGVSVPLLLRGPAPVADWAPQKLGQPQPDLYARIAALNAEDPVLHPAIDEALRARGFTASTLAGMDGDAQPGAFPSLAAAAGRMLAAADGPRIAALDLGGWDTHAGQARRLAGPLGQLDAGLQAMRRELGPAWRQTAVLVMTEFGRTVRENGTGGTDHGTATLALLAGGTVAGGRIGGTWPGLAAGQLFENRDLAPTTDLRAVAKGVLAAQFGLRAPALTQIFPGSASVAPMGGVLRG